MRARGGQASKGNCGVRALLGAAAPGSGWEKVAVRPREVSRAASCRTLRASEPACDDGRLQVQGAHAVAVVGGRLRLYEWHTDSTVPSECGFFFFWRAEAPVQHYCCCTHNGGRDVRRVERQQIDGDLDSRVLRLRDVSR